MRRSGKTEEEGTSRLSGYMETLGCLEGHLVIFDRRPEVPVDDKLSWKTVEVCPRTVHVVCC